MTFFFSVSAHNATVQTSLQWYVVFYLKNYTSCCSSWWQQKTKHAQQMCLAWFVYVKCLCNEWLKATFIECLSVLEALLLGTNWKRSGSTCYRLPCMTHCRRMHGFNDAIQNHASAWSNMWPSSMYFMVEHEVQYIFMDLHVVSASLWARSEEIQGFDKVGHLVYYWNMTVKRVLDTDRTCIS